MTSTTHISAKSAELTGAVVTKALEERFAKELKTLGLTTLPIKLVKVGGERGNLRHKIELAAAGGKSIPVEEIASEGEHRTIALAAFLAELATERSASALIFDDPVCSLDHLRRKLVAERLVKEAELRQVVIFTHDVTFVMALNEALADHPVIDRVDFTILRKGNRPGFCDEGLPWAGKTPEQRIRALRDDLQALRALRRTATDAEYAKEVAGFYGRLQEAWERAIERTLFNGVINRTERDIHTKLLKDMDFLPSDYDAVSTGMGTCSKWRDGHDEPEGLNEPYPEPDQVNTDLDDLDSWVKAVKRRRDLARAQAKEAIVGLPGAVTPLGVSIAPISSVPNSEPN
jgi:hypothetical protein